MNKFVNYIGRALISTAIIAVPAVLIENSERNTVITDYVETAAFNNMVYYCNPSDALAISVTI